MPALPSQPPKGSHDDSLPDTATLEALREARAEVLRLDVRVARLREVLLAIHIRYPIGCTAETISGRALEEDDRLSSPTTGGTAREE